MNNKSPTNTINLDNPPINNSTGPTILLTISYDGTDFCGWQRQPGITRTVQSSLEDALHRLTGSFVPITGSGRTDSGVHAARQAATFTSPIASMPADRYEYALNSFLPQDVRVVSSKAVPAGFSARFSATSRTYRYYISDPASSQSALLNRYTHRVTHNLSIDKLDKLNEACSHLLGEKDFATFTAAGDKSLSTKRFVKVARFFKEAAFFCPNITVFEIEANAFLYRMVRSIVGTLLSLDKMGALDNFGAILSSGNRAKALATAPAKGLFLWEVSFEGKRVH